jgi:nitrogen-specific signal transduction histidine kinase/PAS domain-containing protein
MKTGNPNTVSESSKEGSTKYRTQLQFARAVAIVVMLLSATILSGWLLDLDLLKRIAPRSVPIKVNAALALLLLAVLLHLSSSPSKAANAAEFSRIERLSLTLAILVAAIGFATLLQDVLKHDLGIDELLATDDHAPPNQAPGRMSVLSSIGVLFLGIVFILKHLRFAPKLREWLALGAFGLGYLALMGYVYDAEALYRIGATAVPAPSALCMLLLAGAVLLLPPYYGLMRPVVSKGPGGVLVRRLLPVALFVAPAVDWIQLRAAVHMGESSMALVGLANVALLVVLVWGTGAAVHVAHAHRKLAEENVKTTEERLRLALQAAGGGAWDLDLVREQAWWSTEMYRLWGVEAGKTLQLADTLELIDPQDRDRVMDEVRRAIEGHIPYECEFRLRTHGPRHVWMASRGQVHYANSGQPERLIGITLDISAHKANEASLRQTNEALTLSNVELQRFAHVTAHDLQTPLRSIGSFAELLKTHAQGRLDAKSREWLDRILNSAVHLRTLVRDLLQYSSIDSLPLQAAAVSMDQVLDRAMLLLDAEIRATHCTITRSELPMVLGEESQLTQVLLNLLANAIKYRSVRAPSIDVTVERSNDSWLFSVRDNGIGIDTRHFNRIFEVFERLHTAQEYPGTGIGLAICRRIVQRHGGSIWVESQLGVGSTFFFTLPTSPTMV